MMIPTNARKKFIFNVAPSDRQLWAIGMVVVQWTYIEQMVKVFVHSFTDENDAADPIREQFDSTRSMQIRLDQWEKLTKQYIQTSWQSPMLDLINEIRQVQDMRDKIVHGTWAGKEGGGETSVEEAHGAFSWGKPGHPFSWKLDYHGLLTVAQRIDKLHNDMFQFAFRAGGQTEPSEGFRVGLALRRIQNTVTPK
jgi:hypothetical protein